MSFLTKSVNYSETILLKTKLLKPILELYNKKLLESCNKKQESVIFTIPNNGKKYYLFITKKNQLEQCNLNYNIMYFFSEDSDFYIETNALFNDVYLLEGYIYNNNTFLLTDLLVKNETCYIDLEYTLRYTLLNEFMNMGINKYNNLSNFKIDIHHVLANSNLLKVFENNFIYKNELVYTEEIDNIYKTNKNLDVSNQQVVKYIEKVKKPDIYNVYNINTKVFEGILYIKGIYESQKIKELISKSNEKYLTLLCKYNKKFSKWQPLITDV